jgi:type I restriction enzyme S subunit
MVPSHWTTCRIKNTAKVNPAKSEVRDMAPDTEVAFIPMEAIGEKGELDTSRTKPLSEVISGYSYVADGDIMIAKITPCFENGKGAIARNLANGIGFATTEVINIRPNNPNDAAYFLYLLSTDPFRKLAEGAMYGAGGQKRVADSFVAEYHLSLPALSERTKIAAFLDHETAKIDALIEKQQRLIELLKEKRQAVISHAVTKGLNRNATMKDSGVEWLGEVPAHWDVHAIKHIVSTPITDGPHETPEFFDTGIPFVSAEAVSSGRIDFEKIRAHISDADNQRFSKKYSPKKFDIYMVKSGATTGVTAIVETDDVFNIWSPLAAIRCNELNYPYFVLNFMRSRNFSDAIAISWSFGTQQNIGMKVIENLPITRPPLSEAIEIAKYLQEKSAKFDKIILQAQAQIELMQERRTALISAAVTGKIDVRDWQAAA